MNRTLWAALMIAGILGLTAAEPSFAGGACCALKGAPQAEDAQSENAGLQASGAETFPAEQVKPAVKNL